MAIAHLRRDPVTSSGRVTFPEVRGALMVILETILHDATRQASNTHSAQTQRDTIRLWAGGNRAY
jgi:hypothetical protein